MHPIIQRTVGGLSAACYGRHFFFGCMVFGFILYASTRSGPVNPAVWLLFVLNTFLYPYARFAYESVVGFIFGKNVFVVNAVLFMAVKFVSVITCWMAAIFIAPLGLAYLYFYHSKKLR